MPLELLREIARGPFPFKVSGQENIDKLRVLVAAEMVLAQMPDIGDPGPAWVGELTGLGRASLKVPFRGVLEPSPRDE